MSWETISTLITAAVTLLTSVPVALWVGRRMVRNKYQAEIDTLRADVAQKLAEAKSQELENVRKAAGILTESIVPPLEKQITKLNNEVERLNKVLELIWGCPHIERCPVKRGMLLPKGSGETKSQRSGGEREGGEHPNRAGRRKPRDSADDAERCGGGDRD